MEREEVCKTLPDELVERIISMVPFPSIFKARCLSKSWLARLSSISSEQDEGKRRLATSFQNLVCERSEQWGSYCPVLISVDGGVIGCQLESINWQIMPSLSFLPENLLSSFHPQIEGALLLLIGGGQSPSNRLGDIYVANILTRAWKRLPPPPSTADIIKAAKLVVVDKSLQTYKVFLLSCKDDLDPDNPSSTNFIQIYDSRSESWTRKRFLEGSRLMVGSNFVDFNGVLYIVADFDPPKLWALDVEGVVGELELSIIDDLDQLDGFKFYCLVVCKGNIVMVHFTVTDWCFHVLKVDLETRTLVPLAQGPPNILKRKFRGAMPATDGCNIYLDVYDVGVHPALHVKYELGNNRILKYEMERDSWTLLLDPTSTAQDWARGGSIWTRFCLQPGLSAFMAV